MKMDLALNNLQRLKCHETQTNKQTYGTLLISLKINIKLISQKTIVETKHVKFLYVNIKNEEGI